MDRILVSANIQHGPWEALNRALPLAERIGAEVCVLLVLGEGEDGSRLLKEQELVGDVRRRLELIQRGGKSAPHVELFISHGNYEEEVVRFTVRHRVTLLVAEAGEPGTAGTSLSIETIRRRLNCRVELIMPKRRK